MQSILFQMYSGGKLLFADYIFNGYGNAKRDLLNQVRKGLFILRINYRNRMLNAAHYKQMHLFAFLIQWL